MKQRSAPVYILNRCPIKSIWNKTPQEVWTGRKPSVSPLRVFRNIAHAHVLDQKRTKLDDKSANFIFINYNACTKDYKLYDPNNKKIHISRYVEFVEEGAWNWSRNKEEYTLYPVLENHEPEQLQEPPSPTPASPSSS